MSDLNMASIITTNTPDTEKVLETDDKRILKVKNLTSEAQNATFHNGDDDDNDVIVVQIEEGSKQEAHNTEIVGSTLILDKELEKLHIHSKNNVSNAQGIKPVGTKPKNQNKLEPSNQNIIYNEIADSAAPKAQCVYESFSNPKCSKESSDMPDGNPLLPPNKISSALANKTQLAHRYGAQGDTDVQANQMNSSSPKQHLPTLLKSQSLDLYNDDCAFLNSDQKLQHSHLPNINEYRSTDSQLQSPTNEAIQITQETQQISAAETTQHPIQRPNIATTIVQCTDARPIYPNVPYSPYGSPYGSPRSTRRRPPLRESRRISIEKSGSFLQLNQYKLMDQIGQVIYKYLTIDLNTLMKYIHCRALMDL